MANKQIGELAEKADTAVRAGDDDLDRRVDDFQGSLSSIETPTAEDTMLPMRELLGLDRKLREIRGTKAAQESTKVALQQAIEGYRKP